MARICIIGAGAAGLSAIAQLRAAGHDVECFEKTDRVGGHWHTDYEALHLITARDATHFEDFPMPADYPHFPRRDQVRRYIESYADHAGLREHIAFSTEVVSAEPVPAGDAPVGSAGWRVVTSRGDEGIFDGLVVANGHLWSPKVPEVPGTFTGKAVHSSEYNNVGDLEGTRVLVVGAGNSGCDIAVDIAQHRLEADVVVRKGIHFQPKMYFGVPRQQVAWMSEFDATEQDLIARLLARVAIGENTAYPGLPMPESRDLAGGATTVNDLLLYWIQHGRVTVRPGIERYDGKTVHFSDGTSAEYDSIVYATGFNVALPFLDGDLLGSEDGVPRRYAGGILPEGAEKLYFVGLIAPRGPQIPIYGVQAGLVAEMIALQEAAGPRGMALANYFSVMQEPELRIDIVRAIWNDQMADTERLLRSLAATPALATSGANGN